MLGRFELLVVLRNQIADRDRRRRALAVEAVMEALARTANAGDAAALWGLAGLGADIDAELVEKNPERRGQVAAELLATEGAPPEVCAAARERIGADVAGMSRLAAGLVLADGLVASIYGELDAGCCDSIDTLPEKQIGMRLRRLAEKRQDARALRTLAAAARAGIDLDVAARAALDALIAVRQDLGL